LHIRLTTHPRNTLQPLTTMAAIPATPSRFGSSFSGALQAPYNTDAPSMADSLPSVDFGFNDLRERMTAFTHRFDDFIERGRKRVLEERNAFRMNVAELEGEFAELKTATNIPQQLTTNKTRTRNPTHPPPRNPLPRIPILLPRRNSRKRKRRNVRNARRHLSPASPKTRPRSPAHPTPARNRRDANTNPTAPRSASGAPASSRRAGTA
jgi:hypothetical protein